MKMVSDDETARLIIHGVTPEDAGAYGISVSNAFGQASDVINVNIVGKSLRDSLRRADIGLLTLTLTHTHTHTHSLTHSITHPLTSS